MNVVTCTNHVGFFPWTKGVELIDGELPIFREWPEALDYEKLGPLGNAGVELKKIGVVKPSFAYTAMLEIHIYDGEAVPSGIVYQGDRYEARYD